MKSTLIKETNKNWNDRVSYRASLLCRISTSWSPIC